MKEKIIKGIIEFFLIVFSVLFALYLEDVRQTSNERKVLISNLKQLRNSFLFDSSQFSSKLQMLARVDSGIEMVMKRIIDKESTNEILDGFIGTRFYNPINNWSLDKMLDDESFNMLSNNLKEGINDYNFDRNFAFEAIEKDIYENDHEIERYVYGQLKFDFKINPSQRVDPVVKDSAILYSDALKSYLVKKKRDIDLLSYFLKKIPLEAHKTVTQIDKELRELE